jgi:hypothetical protein
MKVEKNRMTPGEVRKRIVIIGHGKKTWAGSRWVGQIWPVES